MSNQNNGLTKQIISVFENRDELIKLLQVNPGLVIIKLGATWCGPCKKIEHVVHGFFATSPPNVICADIDVDESFDLYAYLKQKRMVNGIPVMLMYKKGNVSFVPDDSITGADPLALDAFFKRCGHHLTSLERAYSNL
jgi:thioredoxin-like negative regulator of GroEL